jgi:glycerol kinase
MVGLTRGTSASQIARASLESIAYQTFDVLRAMETDSGISIKQLRVDGGATVNNFLMQFQSDVMSTEVVRPVITETTALGAAYLAGLAVKYWTNADQISKQWQIDRLFSPSMDEQTRKGLLEGWSRAVRATEFWAGN